MDRLIFAHRVPGEPGQPKHLGSRPRPNAPGGGAPISITKTSIQGWGAHAETTIPDLNDWAWQPTHTGHKWIDRTS